MKFTLTMLYGLALLATTPNLARAVDDSVQISIVSSRPDMVSGEDALVRVELPVRIAPRNVAVTLNGATVTSAFRPDAQGHALIGLLVGLRLGDNTLAVFTDGKSKGKPTAQLSLRDFPITGPIFAGPQEKPFYCQTDNFKLPDGSLLGRPLDENCSVKTVVNYVYKPASAEATGAAGRASAAAAFQPLPDITQLPPDVAMTTTTTGEKVPYVVRVETGTINRAIYQFAVLDDPRVGPAGPLTPPKGWNRRLLYSFGGGCPGGWYRQGATLGWAPARSAVSAVVNDNVVGKGYAEAGSTLNATVNNCNDAISAETMMMVKEHIIKTIGKPVFTFGRGGSGGSWQQNQIADNYPGLLDGIIPSMTFPDVQELTQMNTDARLLNVYYAKIGSALTVAQKTAIGGVAELQNIAANSPEAGRISPLEYCPPQMPTAIRFDRLVNPSGVRCDIYDHNIALYGRNPETGYALRPVDNTGVQYGLAALNAGTITPAQFLDLNENIGGYDGDGRVVAVRASADTLALRNAYQTGAITYGANGLARVPIIDVRAYRDKLPNGDEHLKYHSYAFRERLRKANGTIENEIMLLGSAPEGGVGGPVDDYALIKMDEWLTALANDTSSDPIMQKIARAKPADLVDSCWTPDGERIIERQMFSGGRCNEFYPTFGGPRMAAGDPLANNILKCQLKPIDSADYAVAFTDAQRQRLSAIFPEGVCDWSKPGIEQQAPTGTWQSHMSEPESATDSGGRHSQ